MGYSWFFMVGNTVGSMTMFFMYRVQLTNYVTISNLGRIITTDSKNDVEKLSIQSQKSAGKRTFSTHTFQVWAATSLFASGTHNSKRIHKKKKQTNTRLSVGRIENHQLSKSQNKWWFTNGFMIESEGSKNSSQETSFKNFDPRTEKHGFRKPSQFYGNVFMLENRKKIMFRKVNQVIAILNCLVVFSHPSEKYFFFVNWDDEKFPLYFWENNSLMATIHHQPGSSNPNSVENFFGAIRGSSERDRM